MPRKSPAELPRPQKRAAQAAALVKLVDKIWNQLPKVPSFTGKSRFIRAVSMAKTYAEDLAWSLERDAEEVQGQTPAHHGKVPKKSK